MTRRRPVFFYGVIMITIYFAPPGVGKTTILSRYSLWNYILSKFHLNRYNKVFSNFPCKYSWKFDKEDIGKYSLGSETEQPNLILLDESSIEFNNRDYKTMEKVQRDHFKLHRHYKEDWIIASQSYDDMDVTLRRLCDTMYLLKRCTILPYHVKAIRIRKFVQVDDEHHTIVDGYQFDPWYLRPFTTKRFYLPFYWHMFDSWDAPHLPFKKFIKY